MTREFKITLLGSPSALLGGEPVKGYVSIKAQALLFYLAATEEAHRRDALAALLWSDVEEATARKNLRDVLSNLRKLIGPYLTITRQEVGLNPESVEVDSRIFLAAMADARDMDAPAGPASAQALASLAGAAALHKGEFLAGFYITGAPLFEEWMLLERERLRIELGNALQVLVSGATARRDYRAAIRYARQWSALDALQELPCRTLMQLYAEDGDRPAAMQQYKKLRELLEIDLGVEPASETTALYEQIRDGTIVTRTPGKGELNIRGYELREMVNEGDYAAVYRAYQPMAGRNVAIKIINPQVANQPDFIRRFEFEAQLVATLEHPFIVPLYDFWREPDCAFLVMRWLPGGSLQDDLEQGPWELASAGHLLDQIGSALATAHNQDIVHRDIKPANILLDEDKQAYLSDFGIAGYAGSPLDPKQPEFRASSPEYASPELLVGGPVTASTDVFSLGIMLYEILVGEPPVRGQGTDERLRNSHWDTATPTAVSSPDLPDLVKEVIRRATATDPADRFPDALSLARAFRRAIGEEVYRERPRADDLVQEMRNPYKGLRPFEENDSGLFFGRQDLVRQLLDRISSSSGLPSGALSHRFLALVGPSGCGKSSAIRAGLLPAIRQGAIPGSENWFIAQMQPSALPLQELEQALLSVAVEYDGALVDELRQGHGALEGVIRRCLPGDNGKLVLIIDQFEELFTLVDDEGERKKFLEILHTAVTSPDAPLTVIIVLRADFYDQPLRYPDFGQLVRDNLETILPPAQEELIQAVVLPAEQVGVRLEKGLEAQIVSATADQPGALPLMQYALTELFEKRAGDRLTWSAYQEIGGVTGALGGRADELYRELQPDAKEVVRQLFLHLVKLGQDGELTRRRVLRAELESLFIDKEASSENGMTAVIDLYGRHRLLTFDRDPVTRAPTVEVAHEALFQEWVRLRNWLDDYREDILLGRRLESTAAEWLAAGRDPGFVLRGSRLDQLEHWVQETDLAFTPIADEYLEISLAARRDRQAAELARIEHEEALENRSRTFLRILVIVLALSTAVALILTASAQQAQRVAQGEAEARATQQEVAESASEARATQQVRAEEQADIATSRELAATALNQLSVDPERSILLSLQALSKALTLEAENALHQAVQSSRLLRTLGDHASPIFFVAFSPDGSKFATTGEDNLVRIWNAGTGQELLALAGHQAPTIGIDFSPDGKRLATSSYDQTAIVWDVFSGAQLLILTGHESEITSIHFSPDGRRLVTNGQYDGQIKVWDATTGEELNSFRAHEAPMWFVTYSPAGNRLATASVDRTARVWDAATNEELLILGGHEDVVSRVNFSPDGQRLATSSMKARIWDAATGTQQLVLDGHHGMILWVDFSPDGKWLATSGFDGVAKVWDASSGEELFALSGHTGPVLGLAFSPDGERLVTASFDGSIRIWDLMPERELLTLSGHEGVTYSVEFGPDGTRLISGSFDGTAKVWDLADPTADGFGSQLLSVGDNDSPNGMRAVSYSPDGARFIATSAAGQAVVYDAATGQQMLALQGHAPGLGGETTYNGITGADFSPDGKLIATASDDLTARIWDASTGDELFTLKGHDFASATVPPHEGVIKVTFNPASSFAATAGADGTVKMWSVEDGRMVLDQLAHPDSAVVDLAFNHDGSLLATGAFDGSTKVSRVSETPAAGEAMIALQELYTLIGHTSAVYGVSFTPDGSRLATASEDGTAKLWDAATGQELLTLTTQPQGLLDLAITPDGKYLATAGRDGAVRVFVLPLDELIKLAQSRVTRSLTDEECRRYMHLDSCQERP